ncbi:F-box family protein [Cinnamomum micranthum f. kanehirae]|uniref:F-box family protein n=1 Tax=Cinnamomum micranthum f. kanehirae TaxID=337451 RepID=A0A443N2B2_9MAGN|nr:F-box family protein [Cinnamomum micranthum f. kanehirae]
MRRVLTTVKKKKKNSSRSLVTPTLPPPAIRRFSNSYKITWIRSSSRNAPCNGIHAPTETLNPTITNMDALLNTILGLSDPFPASSLDLSLERLLDSTSSDPEKNQMIDAVLRFGSALQESARKSRRKRACLHNSISWPLPPDLTVKVFSALDTQSLCHAAATCSMFNKCAMDPLCYANIDLTSILPKVNNTVVCTMIQRAGKNLQSLKLGILPAPTESTGTSRPMAYSINIPVVTPVFSWNDKRSRQGKESCVLTRSCLLCLSMDSGAAGSLLRSLHLYNIDRMDNAALCSALSSCPSLLDLEVVGLHVELKQTLEAVSTNCHLMERLFFESSKTGMYFPFVILYFQVLIFFFFASLANFHIPGRDDSLKSPTCSALVNGCPSLTSLALRGFKLQDNKIRVFLKGFRKLKVVDFSTSYSVTGTFLRNVGSGANGHLLEVLILRDCIHLKEVEVARFLSAVLDGDCKLLNYLDISNKEGLAAEGDWYSRCYTPSFPEIEHVTDSEVNSDGSLHLQLSSQTSDGSSFMNSSDSSYTSDQGSGNEDGCNVNYTMFEESSDELDFLVM